MEIPVQTEQSPHADERSLRSDLHRLATSSIVLSVLMIAAGVLALFVPSLAGVTVTIFLGSLLILGGVLHLGFAWHAVRPAALVWEIVLALLYGGLGVFLVAKPSLGLQALTLTLTIFLVVVGSLELAMAFALRPLPGSGWLLFDGIAFVALAVLTWTHWPAASNWMIGALVAIGLLVSGLSRLFVSVTAQRVLRLGEAH